MILVQADTIRRLSSALATWRSVGIYRIGKNAKLGIRTSDISDGSECGKSAIIDVLAEKKKSATKFLIELLVLRVLESSMNTNAHYEPYKQLRCGLRRAVETLTLTIHHVNPAP
jgi:hypothetical protein